MGVFFDEIPDHLISWIREQKLYWVASAPLDPGTHVNVSPKGYGDTFHIVSPRKVWYEDLTGSGVETISHVRENGRITIMFMAFEGQSRIVRLYGKAKVHEFGTPEYEALIPAERRRPGSRSAITIDIDKVGSSCGFAVPFYEYKGPRGKYNTVALKIESADVEAEQKISSRDDPSSKATALPVAGLKYYWKMRNTKSLDGLPALQLPEVAKNFPTSPGHTVVQREGDGTTMIKTSQRHPTGNKWFDDQVLFAFTSGVATAAIAFDLLYRWL